MLNAYHTANQGVGTKGPQGPSRWSATMRVSAIPKVADRQWASSSCLRPSTWHSHRSRRAGARRSSRRSKPGRQRWPIPAFRAALIQMEISCKLPSKQ
eukprot:630331-Amphidinium_carterae.1